MLLEATQTAGDAYRKVELDARIEGTSGPKLGLLCLEAVTDALGQAITADTFGQTSARSFALVKANTVTLGLLRSVDPSTSAGTALADFYRAASRIIAQSMQSFDSEAIRNLHNDFDEIGVAMAQAAS